MPACLDDLAGVVLARGDPEAAARLAGASRAWESRAGLPRAPLIQADRSLVLEELAIGPHAAAWQAGTALTREQLLREAAAVAAITAPPRERSETKPLARLTLSTPTAPAGQSPTVDLLGD